MCGEHPLPLLPPYVPTVLEWGLISWNKKRFESIAWWLFLEPSFYQSHVLRNSCDSLLFITGICFKTTTLTILKASTFQKKLFCVANLTSSNIIKGLQHSLFRRFDLRVLQRTLRFFLEELPICHFFCTHLFLRRPSREELTT